MPEPKTACGLNSQTLSTILPSNVHNKQFGNILLYRTSVISTKDAILTVNADVL